MKTKNALLLLPVAVLSAILLAPTSASADENVLVDETFQGLSPGQPIEAMSNQGVPVKQPTSITARAGSSFDIGEEAVGSIVSPYGLFTAGTNAKGGVEEIRVRWDLGSNDFTQGTYELSYTIAPLQDDFFGGMLQLHLTSGGKDPADGFGLHRLQYPLYTVFRDNTLRGLGFAAKAQSFTAYNVVMTLDLDKRTWGITINNRPHLTDQPMPEPFNDPAVELAIRAVSLASWSGAAHTPDHKIALGNLKLIRKP
jgi:hypothetical protein